MVEADTLLSLKAVLEQVVQPQQHLLLATISPISPKIDAKQNLPILSLSPNMATSRGE